MANGRQVSCPRNYLNLLSLHQSPDTSDSTTPWRLFLPLLILGFAARVAVAVTTDVPLHYDEVMQYLEQAHRLVFGYGIVPWEYREGTRPWLVPGFISGILYSLKVLGGDSPEIYIVAVKIVFCAVSLLIPAGMYLFGRVHLGERCARIALILGCFWYELVVFAHKPMTTFVATALIFLALAIAVQYSKSVGAFLAALAFTLAIAVRIQLAPVVVLMMTATYMDYPARQKILFVVGVILIVVSVGFLDQLNWGGWWHTYVRNIDLNLFKDVASGFGSEPWYQYAVWLLLASGALFYLAFGWAAVHIKKCGFLLVCLLLIVVLHSLIGHKEYRFIFLAIPLWLMIIADVLAALEVKQSSMLKAALALICTLGITNQLPWQDNVYLAIGYTVDDFLDRRSDRQAYLQLSRDESVTGVIDLTNHWSISGGYYYLHKKVPLYDRSLYQTHLQDRQLTEYASHILATSEVSSVPGFKRVDTFSSDNDGNLVLWRRTVDTDSQYVWENYTLNQ